MANPYESPMGEWESPLRENRLRDLCLWPFFAPTLTVLLPTPDIYFAVGAASSPLSFLAGVSIASGFSLSKRTGIAIAAFALISILLAALVDSSPNVFLSAAIHCVGNASMGVITFLNLFYRRRAIVASMAVTYFLGALIGPGGGMLFSILGAIVIDRLPVQWSDNNGMNDDSPMESSLQ